MSGLFYMIEELMDMIFVEGLWQSELFAFSSSTYLWELSKMYINDIMVVVIDHYPKCYVLSF